MLDYTPSHMEWMFWQALALIVAACLFTPLFKKLGLGAILGYLMAGIAVNQVFGGKFAEHPEELLHFSEFGVVLFLFVIGLELKPQVLWKMRGDIFGLGLAQMLGCGAVLGLASWLYGLDWNAALIIGLGLALSSTAIVMSQLDERRERNTPHGRKAFGILLLQDLAIVPLLLMAALLAPSGGEITLRESLVDVGVALGAIAILIFGGRFLLHRMFLLLAKAKLPEIMTASALGVVVASALLMDMAGMSYAMGSFLAGVMLAESSYRHEIEANIEPFRGLFLGLFFMAVGLSLDLSVIRDNGLLILLAAPLAMMLKAAAIFAVTRVSGNDRNTSVRVALALPQHGEFGFVLFAAAAATGLLDASLSALLVGVVSVSMALSALTQKLEPLFIKQDHLPVPEEDYSDVEGCVLIIGFGRFGQVVSQPLFADGVRITILEHDPKRIEDARRFGFHVHFGNGQRRDVLRAAGLAEVCAVIVCTNHPEVTTDIVQRVREEAPSMPVYVRSYDRVHSIALQALNPTFTVRETFESALALSRQVLLGLESDEMHVNAIIKDIRQRDLLRLQQQVDAGLMAGRDQLHVKPVVPQPLDLD